MANQTNPYATETTEDVLSELKDSKVCIRLQAIISSADHPINQVADIIGVTRQTLSRWIRDFQKMGIEGLMDRPKGHRHTKLSVKQLQCVETWIESGKDAKGNDVHWTLSRLQAEIEDLYGVRVGATPLWRQVRKMGFRQKVPRPTHADANREAQAQFKKNSKRSLSHS